MGESEGFEKHAQIYGGGWQRWVFPAVWLVYLAQPISGVHKHSSGPAAVAGYAIVAAFALTYVLLIPDGWREDLRRYWQMYAFAVALTVAEYFFAHQDASVFLVYLAVLTIAARAKQASAAVIAMTLIAFFLPIVVPGWGDTPDWGTAIAVLLAAFAMFGLFHVIQGNRELAAARAEVARLAAENERSRIARDLHDLLGHSLTTITVKAGLARRLAERGEADRSFAEIKEVEQLARRTLGDVRAAVAGHRDVTLAGELATAREVLRAAGIVSELPGSVDTVDCELSEVFAWVLREGTTNVVRHSHAEHCRITLGPRFIEISDGGTGGAQGVGSGLAGLRERLAAVGGTLSATSTSSGFTLRAAVSPRTSPAPVEPSDAARVGR